jgi:hypothetical protein
MSPPPRHCIGREARRRDSAYQTIQSKNARLTTVNLVLASLYREKAEQEKNPAAKQTLLNRAADADNEFKKSETK